MPRGLYSRKKEVVEKKPKVKKPKIVEPIDEPIPSENSVVEKSKNVPHGNCECTHSKAMHYGGEKGNCNTAGCRCSEFR